MKKITAIIVDDEKGVRELLKLLLAKHCEEVNLLGEAGDSETAFELINLKHPDLVFLDIKMPKENGFTLLQRFEKPNFEVIFTTSYAEFAIPAIKANALDYLLKPYDVEELKMAVEKVLEKKIKSVNSPPSEINIKVHNNELVEQVNAKLVISFEAQNNYTTLTLIDGRKYIVAKVLNDFEELVKPLNCFLRIHRSVIINKNNIKNYSKSAPYTITLTNSVVFEISRRKRAEIIEILKNK